MKTEFLLQNKKLIQTILEPYHVHAKGKETIKNVSTKFRVRLHGCGQNNPDISGAASLLEMKLF
jgi:hypothetical protein